MALPTRSEAREGQQSQSKCRCLEQRQEQEHEEEVQQQQATDRLSHGCCYHRSGWWGAAAHAVTSDHASPPIATRVGYSARCTTLGATAPRSAGRSRSSRSSSVSSRSSSSTVTARLPTSGKANSTLPERATMRWRWSSGMPRWRLRSSKATPTASPVTTSAASTSTSSTVARRTSRPSASLSHPVPRKKERSLHTCAQDVQITRMATI
jgi:hypothetical protein